MMKRMNFTALAVAATFLAAAPAYASSIFVMDFDSDGGTLYPSGGPNGSYYEAGDYNFSPANLQSSQQCYDGQCVQEFQNGSIGDFARSDGGDFDFLGFYFALEGHGGQTPDNDNYITVEAQNDGNTVGPIFQIALADLLTSVLPDFSVSWADSPDGDPNAVCKDDQNNQFDKTDRVCNQKGYFVSVLNGVWDDVDVVKFTSSSTAQGRVDNLSASVVPLPAAGWLLLGGLGGLAAMRRRKKTSS